MAPAGTTAGVEMEDKFDDGDDVSVPLPQVVRDNAKDPKNNVAKTILMLFMRTTSEAAYAAESKPSRIVRDRRKRFNINIQDERGILLNIQC